MLSKPATGTASGLAAVLIWSMAAPVVVSAVGIDAFLYVAFGDGIGALLFGLKWVALRQNPVAELRTVPWWFFGIGLIGISVHNLTWVAALQQAPPLEATLIIYTWPLLVIIFTTLSLRQKFHWFHIVGGLLGLAGIAALLLGRGLDLSGFRLMPGHFWAVVSALSWSVFSAISARYSYQSSNFLSVVFALSALINGGIWYFHLGAPLAPVTSLWIAGIAAVFFTAAYALWDFGIKHGNAQLIGTVSFLTPVLAALYLVLLGKAELSFSLVISLVFVLAGIGVAKYGRDLQAPERAG